MTAFSSFDANADPARVERGQRARLRTAAAQTWLAMTPGFAFIRQRSNFIQGWRAAAAAGAPLAAGASAGAVGSADAPPLGSWMMLPDLTAPATQTVLPMNDSLYGAAHLELDQQGPYVVRLPADTDGRYYSVTVMDAHFTNVVHLGPKWSGRDEVEVLLTPPGWDGVAPAGMPVIQAPTSSVCLINRVLVRSEPGDVERVRTWRSGFTLHPLEANRGEPEENDLIHPDSATLSDPWRFFAIGYEHLRRNPLPEPAQWALGLVPEAELLTAREAEWSRAAVEDGVRDAQAMVDAALTTWPRSNGWMLPQPWMGLPNPHVLDTAALELFQVGFNDMAEATYFFGDLDGSGSPLDSSAGARYELSFPSSAAPPVHPDGFWSLTMYGADNLLVANPVHRYSTRPSHPGFNVDPDDGVTITLSHDVPEAGDGPNWLPAPDGPFRLGLRLYYPTGAVLDGSWTPPAVRRTR